MSDEETETMIAPDVRKLLKKECLGKRSQRRKKSSSYPGVAELRMRKVLAKHFSNLFDDNEEELQR